MAAVIHHLWTRGDQSLLIMPGMVPLDAATVRNELLRYLPDTWDAVFDVAGVSVFAGRDSGHLGCGVDVETAVSDGV